MSETMGRKKEEVLYMPSYPLDFYFRHIYAKGDEETGGERDFKPGQV